MVGKKELRFSIEWPLYLPVKSIIDSAGLSLSINRSFDDAKIGQRLGAKIKEIGRNVAKIRTEQPLF